MAEMRGEAASRFAFGWPGVEGGRAIIAGGRRLVRWARTSVEKLSCKNLPIARPMALAGVRFPARPRRR